MTIIHQFGLDVEVEVLGGGDPPRPGSLEGWEEWFDKHVTKEHRDSVNFGIEVDGVLIGMTGLWRFDIHSHTGVLGISIGNKKYWSRGYGREAVGLLLDYGFRLRNLRKISLTTSSSNERAIRCYLACGFVEEGRLRQQLWSDGKYVDEVHMGVLRDEWQGITLKNR